MLFWALRKHRRWGVRLPDMPLFSGPPPALRMSASRNVVTITHPDTTAKLQTRSPCSQSSSPLSGQFHLFCIGTGGCFFNMEEKYIIFKDRLQSECPGLEGRQNSSQWGERERGLLLWDATFAMKGKLLSKPSLHTWEKRDQTRGRYIFLYFK